MSIQPTNQSRRSRHAEQLKSPVFLSASIPDRLPFVRDSDPIAVREAVLGLIAVAARERKIVFGGHPAISPLVEHAATSLDALDHIVIYQSSWFKDVIPPEAKAFPNLRWTPSGRDRADSLEVMRREMIGSQLFCAAVFIGGMEGIFDECRIFQELHPASPLLPVASTNSAARDLWDQGKGPQDENTRYALLREKKYRALFRRLLPK